SLSRPSGGGSEPRGRSWLGSTRGRACPKVGPGKGERSLSCRITASSSDEGTPESSSCVSWGGGSLSCRDSYAGGGDGDVDANEIGVSSGGGAAGLAGALSGRHSDMTGEGVLGRAFGGSPEGGRAAPRITASAESIAGVSR